MARLPPGSSETTSNRFASMISTGSKPAIRNRASGGRVPQLSRIRTFLDGESERSAQTIFSALASISTANCFTHFAIEGFSGTTTTTLRFGSVLPCLSYSIAPWRISLCSSSPIDPRQAFSSSFTLLEITSLPPTPMLSVSPPTCPSKIKGAPVRAAISSI